MEVESALASYPVAGEAAVVSASDELKGEDIVAFVTLEGFLPQQPGELSFELKQHVVQAGAIALSRRNRFTDSCLKPAR